MTWAIYDTLRLKSSAPTPELVNDVWLLNVWVHIGDLMHIGQDRR
jgi:hypothetical protein